MKKTKLSTANTGGVPFQALDFQFIQDESWKGTMAHLNALYENYPYGFVIQGCASTIGGATYNISEGYVYLNGDIIYFPAVTGILLATSPVYYEGTATPEARNYESGGSFTFAESKTVTTSVTSGDTITFTSTGTQRTYLDALTSQPKLISGTWTPVASSLSFVSGVTGFGKYTRIGNIVSFSCIFTLTVTSTGNVGFRFTLPIPPISNFSLTTQLIGTGGFNLDSILANASYQVFAQPGTILGGTFTRGGVAGVGVMFFTGHYEI